VVEKTCIESCLINVLSLQNVISKAKPQLKEYRIEYTVCKCGSNGNKNQTIPAFKYICINKMVYLISLTLSKSLYGQYQ